MKRAGEVLSALFDEGFMKKARGYSAFFSCWKDLTEKNGIAAAADHSWIKSLDQGLVWVEVDHPGWKQILQTKESKLLSDFRYRFPDMGISGLSIMLYRPGNTDSRPDTEAAEPEKYSRQVAPEPVLAAADNRAQNTGYDSIKDEAFREVLMRLEKSIAAREAEK